MTTDNDIGKILSNVECFSEPILLRASLWILADRVVALGMVAPPVTGKENYVDWVG